MTILALTTSCNLSPPAPPCSNGQCDASVPAADGCEGPLHDAPIECAYESTSRVLMRSVSDLMASAGGRWLLCMCTDAWPAGVIGIDLRSNGTWNAVLADGSPHADPDTRGHFDMFVRQEGELTFYGLWLARNGVPQPDGLTLVAADPARLELREGRGNSTFIRPVPDRCVPGIEVECFCPDQHPATALCQSDGGLAACDCASVPPEASGCPSVPSETVAAPPMRLPPPECFRPAGEAITPLSPCEMRQLIRRQWLFCDDTHPLRMLMPDAVGIELTSHDRYVLLYAAAPNPAHPAEVVVHRRNGINDRGRVQILTGHTPYSVHIVPWNRPILGGPAYLSGEPLRWGSLTPSDSSSSGRSSAGPMMVELRLP